jgi:hypothetical protein
MQKYEKKIWTHEGPRRKKYGHMKVQLYIYKKKKTMMST